MLRNPPVLILLSLTLLLLAGCGRGRATPTNTPPPTATATSAPTATPQPTATPLPTDTPAPTATETPAPAAQAVATGTLTATAEATVEAAEEVAEEATATAAATTAAATPEQVTAAETVTATGVITAGEPLTDAEGGAEVHTHVPIVRSDTVTGEAPAGETGVVTATVTAGPEEGVAGTATAEATAGPAAGPAEAPAEVPTQEAAEEPTEAATPTSEPTATATPRPTRTPTATRTATPEPTVTPELTATPEPTATREETATPEPTPTLEATATPEPTVTPRPTATSRPTETPTSMPSPTAIPAATETPTAAPTDTATPLPSPTPAEVAMAETPAAPPASLPTRIAITGAQPLRALIGREATTVAELSPDGSQVAWLAGSLAGQGGELCIYALDGEGDCLALPDQFHGLAYRLTWSPDGAWLAFSEDPAAQALESDLWVLDVASGQMTNLTDDAVEGPYDEVETGSFTLDYLPMWNPATGLLYFWRNQPVDRGGFTLKLMQIEPEGGEPVEVADLTEALGGRLIRYGVQRFYLSGPSAISPDGRTLALLATSAQEMALGLMDGLWFLDLETPGATPRQVAPVAAFQAGLPPWQDQPAVPRGLGWTADGQGVVVAALSNDLRLPLLLVSYVDVASGELTPINDYSSVAAREDFFALPGPGQKPLRYTVPWTVAVAPTANVVLLLNDLGGVLTISQAALPGGAPQMALQQASPGHEVWTRASTAENGAILVYGLLLETEAQ